MINNTPKIALVYDRYSKANGTTKASLEIRITHNRKQKYLSTGIMLLPKQWKRGLVTNCADALQLNQIINKMLVDIRKVILQMTEENNIDISLIPEKLGVLNASKMTFLDYCVKRSEVRKYGKSADSQERYDRFIRLFRLWGGIVEFSEVTESNIIAYDRYLESTGMKPYSKWNNYHRFLNSFILDALQEGLLSRNPYHWVNIEKGASEALNKYLTPSEFASFKRVILPTKSLEKVRDLFIFQTYTCLSYTDLRDFNSNDIIEVKGAKAYVGARNKTGKTFTIPLHHQAIFILEKYDGKLPVISNVKYNYYLKIVAQAAGIDKPVSTHWARHTGATMLLNEGVDMRIVSKICGHSSIKMTEQIYAKLLDETVVDAVKKVEDKI